MSNHKVLSEMIVSNGVSNEITHFCPPVLSSTCNRFALVSFYAFKISRGGLHPLPPLPPLLLSKGAVKELIFRDFFGHSFHKNALQLDKNLIHQ
jgi:hypothetical protein